MYTDISGESIIITLALIGFIVGAGIGAYVSYNKTGEFSVSTVLLYGAVGMLTVITIGTAVKILTAYKVANVMWCVSSVLMADSNPTNELTAVGEYISNSTLSNIFKNFYKGAYTDNPIGNGSTAAAIRHTLNTGEFVGGNSHFQKGFDFYRGVSTLINSGNLNRYDLTIAYDIYYQLKDVIIALGGK